jgi:tetratricopeptide (TPR) repeat protein
VLAERKIAAELDPVSPYAVQAVGGYYSVMGEYEDAIRYFRSALELEPRFGYARQGLGIAYLLQKRPVEAFRELKLATEFMTGPRRLALLGYAYGKSGRKAEARQVLRELTELASSQSVPALAFAHVYLGLEDYDRAFEWMGRAVDEKDLGLTLQWDSHYQSIRSDPRYHALLRRMKLA